MSEGVSWRLEPFCGCSRLARMKRAFAKTLIVAGLEAASAAISVAANRPSVTVDSMTGRADEINKKA